MMRSTRRRWILLALAALTLVALAGAASVTAAGSAMLAGPTAAASRDAVPNLAYVKAQIDKYKALPQFVPPGPAFSTRKVKGKTVLNIPDSSANPFASSIAAAEGQAAKLIGIKFVNCTNQGQVPQWVQCMGQATGRKVGVINDFGGVDPRVIRPQIEAAKRAGIKVVATHVYDSSQPPVAVDYSIPAPYQAAARLVADWVILDTKGKANILVVTSNEVLGTPPIVGALKSEFGKYCGSGCKMAFLNAPVAQWSTRIQSGVQSALLHDPKINYIVPIYDSMSQFVVPAITITHRVGKVHIATYNGTPFVLGYMQKGDIVRMDVGENLNWLGWSYMDADARVLAGLKVPRVFDVHTALRVFTKENVNEAGVPPKLSTGYGNAYQTGYKKLWGVG